MARWWIPHHGQLPYFHPVPSLPAVCNLSFSDDVTCSNPALLQYYVSNSDLLSKTVINTILNSQCCAQLIDIHFPIIHFCSSFNGENYHRNALWIRSINNQHSTCQTFHSSQTVIISLARNLHTIFSKSYSHFEVNATSYANIVMTCAEQDPSPLPSSS